MSTDWGLGNSLIVDRHWFPLPDRGDWWIWVWNLGVKPNVGLVATTWRCENDQFKFYFHEKIQFSIISISIPFRFVPFCSVLFCFNRKLQPKKSSISWQNGIKMA
jgi:hypothetical protein